MTERSLAELLEQADRAFEAEQWAEALAAHTQLVEHNPYHGRLWFRLGVIHDHLSNRDEAIRAYRKAVEIGYNNQDAMYDLGRNLALRGDAAGATIWLGKSIGQSLRNLKRLETDPDLHAIRSDPRFLQLLPPQLPPEISRVDGWRADLRYLATRMQASHYDLFRVVSPHTWRTAVERLHDRIPELDDHEVIVELMRLAALVGDGHTSVSIAAEQSAFSRQAPPTFRFDRIPVMLYLFKDGLFVMAAAPKFRDAVGSRVLRVGEVSAEDALTTVREVVSRDNEMTVRWLAPFALTYPAILHALRIAPRIGDVELVVADDHEAPRTVRVEAEPSADPFQYRVARCGSHRRC